MSRNSFLFIASLILAVAFVGCFVSSDKRTQENKKRTVNLVFQIVLNQRIYQDSAWGDPPQMAIWLLNQKDHSIRTVMVTYRTAGCDWDGKIECAVALPYWVGFYNREAGTTGPPTFEQPAPDAVTFATPTNQLTVHTNVPEDSQWIYFIEVNVSGDFNWDFPYLSDEGHSDRYGNGQPSIVYRGNIEAVDGVVSKPAIVGRTDQHKPDPEIIKDMNGITTALNLLDSITVSCLISPSVRLVENGL